MLVDHVQEGQCGHGVACITTCPTGAIVAPYTVDARRRISYLLIEQKFLHVTEGSAIRRTGYLCWLRNIGVALGNALYLDRMVSALQACQGQEPMWDGHITWALKQQLQRITAKGIDV